MTPDRQYRCRYCGRDLHPAEARPYFKRMETEKIDAVLMDAYELVEAPAPGVDKN